MSGDVLLVIRVYSNHLEVIMKHPPDISKLKSCAVLFPEQATIERLQVDVLFFQNLMGSSVVKCGDFGWRPTPVDSGACLSIGRTRMSPIPG